MIIDKADILLSTYKGGVFLKELLESIRCQLYKEWHLFVRDDGSVDDTVGVINRFAETVPGKVTFLSDPQGNIGAIRSFEELVKHSQSAYVFFCDQDDIWHPDKIARQLDCMIEAEQKYPGLPVLVCSDLRVIDDNGNELSPSFYQKTKTAIHLAHHSYYLFCRNVAVGCATMVNRKALELSMPFGKNAIMHDWWIASTVSLRGRIEIMSIPTIDYRLHSQNAMGIEQDRGGSLWQSLIRTIFSKEKRKKIVRMNLQIISQSRECCERNGRRFSIVRYFWELFLGLIWWRSIGRIFPAFNRYAWEYRSGQ
jgi:glycosyltransferase involved in cell wall biosynthesis